MAAARVPGAVETFRQLTRDNPSQQLRADRLQKLVTERLDTLAANVVLATAPRPDGTKLTAALGLGRQQMGRLRGELTAGLQEENRLLAERDRGRRDTENLEIAFAVGAGVLTLGILMLAAALLVRNNVSLAAAEKARANEAAILQATLETVREGIAYFTSDGLLCAFNARFLEMLDLPPALAVVKQTNLSQLRAHEGIRSRGGPGLYPARRQPSSAPTPSTSPGLGASWISTRRPLATGGFIIGVVDQTERMRIEGIVRQSQKRWRRWAT